MRFKRLSIRHGLLLVALLALISIGSQPARACTNLTPNFTISNSGTCLPRVVTFNNTSTGSLAAGSTYVWKLAGVPVATVTGTGSATYTINTPGTYTFRMVATTAGNCSDSINKTVTITSTTAPRIQDGNGNPSYAPVWQNCITFINSPDSFQFSFNPVDTLKNYTVIWGDGTSNATGTSLAPSSTLSHTYQALGDYTLIIRTSNGGCSDTIFGTVINNRIPTAGIIGPPAGQNSGCAPHAVRFINNSSNVSSSTYFRWTFGDGSPQVITNGPNDTIFHTYPKGLAAAGCNITVRVEAINSCGTSQTTWNPVNIYDIDDARITTATPNLCTPNQTFTMANASVNNCIPGTRYFYWDFGDGTTLGWTTSRASQTKSYAIGTYPVMLVDSNACGRDTTFLNLVVNQVPTTNFSMTAGSGCAPLSINFKDTSTGLLNSYSWNFGDPASGASNTSILKNPSHTFNQQGVFPVRLSVSNFCGTASKTDTVKAYGKPVVQISNVSSGCTPLSTAFTNTTLYNSPSATYLWDMGDNTSAVSRNAPLKTYTTPGTYTIKLKITDTCGTDSATRTFTVYNLPTGKISATRVCAGDTTKFTDSSTVVSGDTINAWLWSFGDATSSTAKNPTHVYAAAGNYTVVLRVTTTHGCIDYDTLSITVDVSPTVSYSFTSGNICDGSVVSFTGSATTPSGTITNYLWNLVAGQTSINKDTSFRFPGPGKYPVSFKATNSFGCSRTFIDSVRIYAVPNASFTFANACRNSPAQFTNTSTIAAGDTINLLQWDFENDAVIDATGQTATKTYTTAGSFNVRLRAVSTKGCVDQDTQAITIRPLPVLGLSVNNTSLCRNDTFVFTNTTTGASSFNWNFGDGNSSTVTTTATQRKNYANAGTYIVKLVATTSFACTDSATVTVIARPLPTAFYTTNDTFRCAPFTFTYTNASTNANTYQWLLNNAPSYTLTNRPDTTVNAQGALFKISLVAYNSFGCKPDTFVRNYRTRTNPLPFFNLSVDSACGPVNVTFSNQSLFASTYLWKFGNGGTSTSTNGSTTYAASQNNDTTYKAWLIATNSFGCKDSMNRDVRVFPKPLAAFNLSRPDSCGPFTVNFTNASLHKYGGTINNMLFDWNFGNGSTSTAKDVSKTFVASLTKDTVYSVRLIGTTLYGCSDTAIKTVRVYPKPKAAFTQSRTDSCGPLSVSFTNNSIPNDTGSINIMTFNWTMGNGATSTQVNPTATYVANSTKDTVYNIRLVAFSEHGCTDTVSKTVRIYPKPLVLFTQNVTSGCGPLQVNFTNQSSPKDTGNISIMTFNWNFGNGATSTQTNTTNTFQASATQDTVYTVKLKGYSEHGCVDSLSRNFTVHPKPIVAYNVDKTIGCFPMTVNFTNNTINGILYSWNFGDGSTSATKDVSYTFKSRPLFDTTYTVYLTALSPFTCKGDTVRKTITVRFNPVPNFVFDPDTACGSVLTRLYNLSLGAASYTWNLGDGTYTNTTSPFELYTASLTQDTIYTAKLYAYTTYGCLDSIQKPLLVAPLPDALLSSTALTGCHPHNVSFNGGLSKRAVSYLWDFGDGNTSTSPSVTHTFNNYTQSDVVYKVVLKVFSDKDCEDTIVRLVTVHPKPVAGFAFAKTPQCDTTAFNFTNASIGATFYDWDFNDGQVSNAVNPLHYFRTLPINDSTYHVKLVNSTPFGCKDSVTKDIVVTPLVIADFDGTPLTGCEPLNVNFTNYSRNASLYLWDFGDLGATSQTDPSHIYSKAGNFTVRLIVIDKYNCRDTLERLNYVHVQAKPKALFVADPVYQQMPNSTVNFTDLSVSPVPLSYLWDFGDGKKSTLSNPQNIYGDSGTYQVKLVVDNGQCTDQDLHSIRIDPFPPLADFIGLPPRGCPPLTVTFTNKSKYGSDFKWYFGDGDKSTEKDPVHVYKYPGKYPVTLVVKGAGGTDDTTREDYITVEEKPFANFRVNPDEVFMPDANVDLVNLSRDGTHYQWYLTNKKGIVKWSDTSENPTAHLVDTGYFDATLIVKNQYGCADTLVKKDAFIVYGKGDIYIPTAFTPDKDNLNDGFKPVYVGLMRDEYRLQIYNRWGEMVFETFDRDASWDGSFKGKQCQQDVYVWEIKGMLVGYKKIVLNGTVTLLR